MSEFLFKKTLIIGLGLIGGSFAKALRKAKISNQIFAFDTNSQNIDAVTEKLIDGFFSLENEIWDFDLVTIATPISSYKKLLQIAATRVKATTIVIELGSVKNFRFKNIPKNFVPCHPIAGSQKTGFANSNANLFLQKKFIICQQESFSTKDESVKKVLEIIKRIGAEPEFLDPKEHDKIYALISHLPQFLSFLSKKFSPKNIKNSFLENAFRLDLSSYELWKDIFNFNQKNLQKFYKKFFINLKTNFSLLEKDNEKLLIKGLHLKKVFGFEDGDSSLSILSKQKVFDKYFEENFAAVFLRFLIALSYLEIKEVKRYKAYAGSGFNDFVSIILILNFDRKKLNFLIKKNQNKIFLLFESLFKSISKEPLINP